MDSKNTWVEVDKAKNENRRELVIVGPTFKEKVEKNGLDSRIFSLSQLNFLDMSGIGLKSLSPEVENLSNLTNLILIQNQLCELPPKVGKLKKLKLLDVNNNCLKILPQEVSGLKELQTLNCNNNQLEIFVDVTHLTNLHSLDISHNKLTSLPKGIDSSDFTALLTINASDNEIDDLSESLWQIPTLKNLDLSNNKINTLSVNMADCFKLKDFKCTGNNLKDRRLKKLVEQCSTKAILDYLSNQRGVSNEGGGKGASKKVNKKEKQKIEKETELRNQPRSCIKVLKFTEDVSVLVKATSKISETRPYLVCCVVRNVDFNKNPSLFKLFINLQTKLHETSCAKRTTATIATHDLQKISQPILYDARSPSSIQITPLNGNKSVTSDLLVKRLVKEAEMMRKEKKKSNYAGVHKYLNLVTDKSSYACLSDSSGLVISFPPITNSQETRVTSSTKHLLLEVSGPSSLEVCKKVMDELVYAILQLGVGTDDIKVDPAKGVEGLSNLSIADGDKGTTDDKPTDGEGGEEGGNEEVLVIEQVKVIDEFNKLKVLYPSRTDLTNEAINVVRTFD